MNKFTQITLTDIVRSVHILAVVCIQNYIVTKANQARRYTYSRARGDISSFKGFPVLVLTQTGYVLLTSTGDTPQIHDPDVTSIIFDHMLLV